MQLRIYDKQQLVCEEPLVGSIELGRQLTPGEPLFVRSKLDKTESGSLWRMAIARRDDELHISRRHVWLEPLASGVVRVRNLSDRGAVRCDDGTVLAAGIARECPLPLLLSIGDKAIRVEADAQAPEAPINMLATPTMAPCTLDTPGMMRGRPAPALASVGNTELWVEWLQAVVRVLQSAASSTDFYHRAAEGIVELVGLDAGRVLLLDGERWRVETIYSRDADDGGAAHEGPASKQVLGEMRRQKRTIWQTPAASQGAQSNSLLGVQAVVAAPILDRHGAVIGALYGDRLMQSQVRNSGQISKLEAMLVETLASGVAAGLARLEHEQAAIKAQVQFEQFFTPELSRQLAADPNMLTGRDAEVTLLFCDVRNFSRISERLPASETMRWIGSVMGLLSDCVSQQQGVLVDFTGDEVFAMWGAPAEQPQHAVLACRAALDMLAGIPKLNERWQDVLKEPIRVGVGINTGVARVGNTGSDRKLKYGPLGNTVNLASRVQGATKYLKAELVVTAATRAKLGPEFVCRRLCKVRVVNIQEPIELFELRPADQPHWAEMCRGYEEALAEFEAQEFRKASRTLGKLVNEYPHDGPALLLMSRAVGSLVADDGEFDPVWELPGK